MKRFEKHVDAKYEHANVPQRLSFQDEPCRSREVRLFEIGWTCCRFERASTASNWNTESHISISRAWMIWTNADAHVIAPRSCCCDCRIERGEQRGVAGGILKVAETLICGEDDEHGIGSPRCDGGVGDRYRRPERARLPQDRVRVEIRDRCASRITMGVADRKPHGRTCSEPGFGLTKHAANRWFDLEQSPKRLGVGRRRERPKPGTISTREHKPRSCSAIQCPTKRVSSCSIRREHILNLIVYALSDEMLVEPHAVGVTFEAGLTSHRP